MDSMTTIASSERTLTRRIVTVIPGPASRALAARKTSAVSAGVGTIMPVFADRAHDGVVVDVDGNVFIDLGSGIAVTTVGSSAPRVVEAVTSKAAEFTHTCFMVTPYESYVAVAEKLNELTPWRPSQKDGPVQLRG